MARCEIDILGVNPTESNTSFTARTRHRIPCWVPKLAEAVLNWVQDLAPVIIHVNLDSVGRFLESDDYYRTGRRATRRST